MTSTGFEDGLEGIQVINFSLLQIKQLAAFIIVKISEGINQQSYLEPFVIA
jgi:hypothetical protein